MTPERWRQITGIYHEAAARRGQDREAYLAHTCGGDAALRREIESLLAQDPLASVLATPATLSPGSRIGAYELLEVMGAGGMGIVYRARDLKLQRDVALKVLPEAVVRDPDRIARFRREATVLASLNHPSIGAIYGFEDSGEVHALVLELVEGPTLADRIAQGAIPVDEALPIAKQIAEALEAAHEHGVIHRDLKPANIKVRDDGTVKVLDFGLAKALEPSSEAGGDVTASPTITSPALMTGVGVLLGTAAYMSPEQAKGKPADKRSDVWAFGCVLYEMLTGRRAFEGDDVSDTLAAVLRGEPDWTALPVNVSSAVIALIRGCLEKDRRRRVGDISTARFVFGHRVDAQIQAPARSAMQTRRIASLLIVSAATAIAASLAWMLTSAPPSSPPVARLTIPLAQGESFSNLGVHGVAISQDGSRVVYAANGRLYLRRMDQLQATAIRGTEGQGPAAGRQPFFSPDGQWIGFWQDRHLKKVSINGGAPLALCEAENPWGATWTSDNTILYGQDVEGGAGIWRVSSEGGKPEQLVKVETGQAAEGPQMLPSGRAVLFTLAQGGDAGTGQIVIQSLDTGRRQVVLERGFDARYLPTGHLVYALGDSLFAVPFDPTAVAVTGAAVPVVEGVAHVGPTAHFATSSQGALVYVPADAVASEQSSRTLAWIDREGHEDPINTPPRAYIYPRLSPDATRVALDVRDQENDIWIWDLTRGTLTRLTNGPAFDQYPVWTPDGQTVIYSSAKIGGPLAPRSLFRRRSDGTGTVEPLTEGGTAGQFPYAVSPDGTALIFMEQTIPKLGTTTAVMDLFLLPLHGEHRPRALVQTLYRELNGEVSPDGRWLAYQSDESGRPEIYVRPFPNVDAGKWLVSTAGGTQPLWARSGKELFFVSSGRSLMSVRVMPGPPFEAGTPTKLLDNPFLFSASPGRAYDVSPDGKRFLMIREAARAAETPRSPRLIVVLNWQEELKRLVPTK